MSRTDKDIPYRLREYREGEIKHNHERGECRVETREHALSRAHWYSEGRNHWRNCKKTERVKIECPGRIECWKAKKRYTDALRFTTNDAWFYNYVRKTALFTKPENYGCREPHYKNVTDESVPCSFCDTPRETPTCEWDLPWSLRHSFYSTAPAVYRNEMERGNRRKVNGELQDARRDWNQNGDTDVEPLSKYGAHSAAWYYW